MWESPFYMGITQLQKRHNLLENSHISFLNNQDLLTESLYLGFQNKIMKKS